MGSSIDTDDSRGQFLVIWGLILHLDCNISGLQPGGGAVVQQTEPINGALYHRDNDSLRK
jgi:hypothetical protein